MTTLTIMYAEHISTIICLYSTIVLLLKFVSSVVIYTHFDHRRQLPREVDPLVFNMLHEDPGNANNVLLCTHQCSLFSQAYGHFIDIFSSR